MKKFLQYVAMIVLMLGAILPSFGMEVKAQESTDASCTIDYSANLNVRDASQTKDSIMNTYINKNVMIQQQKNGQYTVDITVPKAYVEWYTGFKVKSGGELKEAIKRTKDMDGNEIYTFAIDNHNEAIEAWVHPVVPAINYNHQYTVYLVFSDVKENTRVCEEAPKKQETLEQNKKEEMKTEKDSSTGSTAIEKTDGMAGQQKDNTNGNTNGTETSSGQNNNHSDPAGNDNSNAENAEQSTNSNIMVDGTTANFKQEGLVRFEFPQHEQEITAFLQTSNTVFEDNKYKVTLSLNTQNKLQEFTVKQNGRELAKWSNNNKIASLVPVAIQKTASLSFDTKTLDNLVFEAVTDDKIISANVTATKNDTSVSKNIYNTNLPNAGGGASRGSTQSTNGLYTVDYTFIRGSGSGTSMMDQYVIKPAYVVRDGSSYQVQLTLTNSSWITGFTVNGETPRTISDVNDARVIQFTVPNLSERYSAWVKVDIEDINYHHDYNIFLQFNEASLSKISDSTVFPVISGPINSRPLPNNPTPNNGMKEGTTGEFVQEGAVRFEFVMNAKEIAAFLQKANTVFEDNKYKVTLSLNPGKNLQQFIVKQNGQEIAKWSNSVATLASVAQVKSRVLSFEVETLDNLVFEVVTTDTRISTNVKAIPATPTPTPATNEKITRQPITYKMEADPNGKIPDFITNYLAPYFTKAELVTIDDKRFIEITLIGKAYGFETIAYIDADGKQQNIEIISSTGEKLDQVRVIRLPLVQDRNGVTKIFVDSGSLGYGAYTLFFTFNVPALEEETKVVEENTQNTNNLVKNPFTDIENVFSKDEILSLYAAGITNGTTATTFSPNRNITRAQFAVMIARALKLQSNKDTAFTDVKGKWYQKEVQALAEVGIVRGVNATTFNPNANITRQQAAALIMRMLEYKGYKVTVAENALSYKDANKVADYAKQAISELQAQDIMTGSNGYINPHTHLTCAQMAKILKRSLQLVNLI